MDFKKLTRRQAIVSTAAALAGGKMLSLIQPAAAQAGPSDSVSPSIDRHGKRYGDEHWDVPGKPGEHYTPVVTPNGWTLPFRIVDGVKVFHLVSEEVVGHEFTEGLVADCWGFNGSVHGPTIEAVEGDRVRIYVTNKLPAATAIHWHGILLPNGMDGVGGLNQKVIAPGETYLYEFTLRQHGTHMYHSHHDEMTQMAMGMLGLFIIHPRAPLRERPDRDFAFMLSEWRIDPDTRRPNPLEMNDFNVLTLNARVFPGTAPMVAKLGDRVRIRLGNLSAMDHHSIHLHGYRFKITETDGGPIPEAAQWPEVTVLVPVGATRTFDFVADEPGDWAMHCHMTHHVMNQMGHEIPNTMGVDRAKLDKEVASVLPQYMTMGEAGMAEMGHMGMAVPSNSVPMLGAKGQFDYITMGGMFTILKVRPGLTSYEDPGWYANPKGTVSSKAVRSDLQRDGIDADSAPRSPLKKRQSLKKAHGTSTPVVSPKSSIPALKRYVCPMHEDVQSDSPGKCPKCGMTLTKQK